MAVCPLSLGERAGVRAVFSLSLRERGGVRAVLSPRSFFSPSFPSASFSTLCAP